MDETERAELEPWLRKQVQPAQLVEWAKFSDTLKPGADPPIIGVIYWSHSDEHPEVAVDFDHANVEEVRALAVDVRGRIGSRATLGGFTYHNEDGVPQLDVALLHATPTPPMSLN